VDANAPESAKKEFQKASQLANKGQAEEAIERYKHAISIYPEYVMAHNDLGVQYLNLKRFAEARTEFETAIEISAKAFNPHLNMGILLVGQRHYAEALDQLRQAESLDSSSPAAHLYLGIAAEETDDVAAAERDLGTALSLGGPEYSISHFYLGLTRLKKAEAAIAAQDLRSYLKASPNGEHASRARKLLESIETSSAKQ
jgi:type IV pilus assembly protein PilF